MEGGDAGAVSVDGPGYRREPTTRPPVASAAREASGTWLASFLGWILGGSVEIQRAGAQRVCLSSGSGRGRVDMRDRPFRRLRLVMVEAIPHEMVMNDINLKEY